MKIEIVSDRPGRDLGMLNSRKFFCKCGMTQAGVDHICTLGEKVPKRPSIGEGLRVPLGTKERKLADEGVRGPSLLDRLFPDRWFSTQVIVAAIVVIMIIVFAFNSWA